MSAADEFKKLRGMETILLADIARLDEQRAAKVSQLTELRGNLAGVKLGQRLAEEQKDAPPAEVDDA